MGIQVCHWSMVPMDANLSEASPAKCPWRCGLRRKALDLRRVRRQRAAQRHVDGQPGGRRGGGWQAVGGSGPSRGMSSHLLQLPNCCCKRLHVCLFWSVRGQEEQLTLSIPLPVLHLDSYKHRAHIERLSPSPNTSLWSHNGSF